MSSILIIGVVVIFILISAVLRIDGRKGGWIPDQVLMGDHNNGKI
jgi:hypothetical protein